VGPERQPHCPDGAQTALIAFGHRRFPPPCCHRPPPRADLRGVHRRRSSSFLTSSSAHARLCFSSCRADADCRTPLPELHPRAPPLHCQAGQASAASFARRCLEPSPQQLFPDHRTPPTIKLHWLPSRSVDATPTTARASATFPNRELLTTTTGRRPSLPFPSGRALLSNVPPVISPPRRVTLAPLPNPPCHRLS
jgi:hypothetical protein